MAVRRWIGRALFVLVLASAGALGWLVARDAAHHPRTADAEIDAEIVHVAAALPGRIVDLPVAENQAVAAGDLLLRLDPEPFRLALAQARAELAAAEAALGDQRRAIAAERANARTAGDEVSRAAADLALARRTVERLAPLAAQGFVSQQELDQAVTVRASAEIALRQARQTAGAADDLIQTDGALVAQVAVARAAVALAKWELENTEVRAPFAGRVVGLKVRAGEYLMPGMPVFTLIDTADWTAQALFRETDLHGLRPGDPATVRVMIAPETVIQGVVDSIGWGIQSVDAADLGGGLPYVARTLDWVRVAKRFPVRIRLIDPPAELMRVGASAVVTVVDDRGV